MTTTTAPRPIAAVPGMVRASTEAFLDECAAERLHPDEVAHRLRRAGWDDGTTSIVGEQYRRRFDEHPLGYAGFLFSVGFSALAAGSIGHHALAVAEGRDPSPESLAFWLMVLVVALPFGVWSWLWVRRVDEQDPVAAWSRPRRTLAQTLLWACGIVGGARLLHYVFVLMSTLTGSSWAGDRNLLVGLANVAVTAGITVPLGLWSFKFLHRFDRKA